MRGNPKCRSWYQRRRAKKPARERRGDDRNNGEEVPDSGSPASDDSGHDEHHHDAGGADGRRSDGDFNRKPGGEDGAPQADAREHRKAQDRAGLATRHGPRANLGSVPPGFQHLAKHNSGEAKARDGRDGELCNRYGPIRRPPQPGILEPGPQHQQRGGDAGRHGGVPRVEQLQRGSARRGHGKPTSILSHHGGRERCCRAGCGGAQTHCGSGALYDWRPHPEKLPLGSALAWLGLPPPKRDPARRKPSPPQPRRTMWDPWREFIRNKVDPVECMRAFVTNDWSRIFVQYTQSVPWHVEPLRWSPVLARVASITTAALSNPD